MQPWALWSSQRRLQGLHPLPGCLGPGGWGPESKGSMGERGTYSGELLSALSSGAPLPGYSRESKCPSLGEGCGAGKDRWSLLLPEQTNTWSRAPGDSSHLTEGSIQGCPERARHAPSLRGRAAPARGASPVYRSFSGRPPLTSYLKTAPHPHAPSPTGFPLPHMLTPQFMVFISPLSAPPTGIGFS